MDEHLEPGERDSYPTALELDIRVGDEPGGRKLVAVAGELDLHTAPRLESALNRVIDSGGTELVLDCTDLRFMDSTGLGVLVAALKRAREAGADMVLRSPGRLVDKLLRITKLESVFTIER